jgi:hypothetical protein
VYVLHVTERCVIEFTGLAGAKPLDVTDALPMLLGFAAHVVLAEPGSEAAVVDAFDGAFHEPTPTPLAPPTPVQAPTTPVELTQEDAGRSLTRAG